jgi:hypothetical protein
MIVQTILWRRLDLPGFESSQLISNPSSWVLKGGAVFLAENAPCRLTYRIECDEDWRTREVTVEGWLGNEVIDLRLKHDGLGNWLLNEKECPQVEGCLDVDLNFSPSTNLLPIRRLKLEPGREAEARAAWLRFPEFTLERLDQVYLRNGINSYRYGSADGEFQPELEVNSTGFVIRYADAWVAEAIA